MTPATLPAFVVVDADEVHVGRDGQVVSRALADGRVVASGPIDGTLAGGWTIDGARVLRDGQLITTLTAAPVAVTVAGDTLWVSLADGVYLVRAAEDPERIERDSARALVPVGGGVARTGGRAFTRHDARGERICGVTTRVDAMVGGPTGELLVVSRDGLSVWDARCMRIGGAPVVGDALGFAPDGRLVVVGVDQAIHVLSWPSLAPLATTPPGVDASWVLDEGPTLRKGDWVYDPQTGRTSVVPAAAPRSPEPAALAYVGPTYAVHAASGPAQVFEIATRRTVGVPLTDWLEQLSLSPDGRLLVGIAHGEACAYEVATGRRLWAAPVERQDRVEVYGTFVAIIGDRARRLVDPANGAERWTITEEQARPRRREDALVIHAGSVEWRSDTGGTLPLWTTKAPILEEPARGAEIVGP